MTILLPAHLETRLRAAVQGGRFASVDDAMAEAARLLLRELDRTGMVTTGSDEDRSGLGSIGAMRDAAEELDQVVADAYHHRREDSWRDFAVE